MGTTISRGKRKPRVTAVEKGAEPVVNPAPLTSEHVHVGDEAAGLIRGPRAKFYGHPKYNLKAIGDAWEAYLSTKHKRHVEVTAHDVCMMMVLLKAMRAAQGYHRDSAVDVIGYTLLDEVLEDGEAMRAFEIDVLGIDPDYEGIS